MIEKTYHTIASASQKVGTRLIDILLGSRDAMEFWQALFAVWWGYVMVYTEPSTMYDVYGPLLRLGPDILWGGVMGMSGLVVMAGLFLNDVLHLNGGASTMRRWGMTAHAIVVLFVFFAFVSSQGLLGSTAAPAYGILSGSAVAITLRHWFCRVNPC